LAEQKKTLATRLFLIVIFCIILYVALDAIAQILPPHYSPISLAESLLAVGEYWYIMTVNFLNRGFLSLMFIFAFVVALNVMSVSTKPFRLGIALLAIWAVGAILLAFFPATQTWQGAFHLTIALVAFIGGGFGTLEISRKMNLVAELRGVARIANILSMIVVASWAVEFLLPFVTPHLNAEIGGLTERIFLGGVLLWVGIVSGYFATHLKSRGTLTNQMSS
jgi:hypothetical protein